MYSLAIHFYAFIIALISPFHKKARIMRLGQWKTNSILREKIDRNAKYIWFHASSLGEFEQGRPMMEKIKAEHPDTLVVFIGPCASKKLEAMRTSVRSDVDFVITFEELAGMFEARDILVEEIQALDHMEDATAAGRGYGVAGGVASAIEECIKTYYPDTVVHIEHAESLAECKKALLLAKAGKMNGCLIEGMACPGGCIAGAGTNIAINQAAKELNKFKEAARFKVPQQ